MNVQVDAFNVEYRFLVQPHVTIGQLFERLAVNKLHLQMPKACSSRKHHHPQLGLFGLQVLNERLQTVVWADPALSLAAAIKQGMAFQPMAIRFRLRAHAFPPSLEAIRGDTGALELLYRQAEAKLLKAAVEKKKTTAEKSATSKSLLDSGLVASLVAMSLIVDYGAFVVATSRFDADSENFLLKEATGRARELLGAPSTLPPSPSVGQSILQLWRLFGLMSVAEAQYNYLSLLASSEDYSVEKVRFSLVQLHSDFEKTLGERQKKVEKKKKVVRLAVSYQGVEVIGEKKQTSNKTDSDQEEEEEENGDVTSTSSSSSSSLFFAWSKIRLFKQHKRSLTIKMVTEKEDQVESDDESEAAVALKSKKKKQKPSKMVFSASSNYEAHLIYLLITAYHGEHSRRVWRSEFNRGTAFKGISTEVRFVLPQPEHFFGQVTAQMAELAALKLQMQVASKMTAEGTAAVVKAGDELVKANAPESTATSEYKDAEGAKSSTLQEETTTEETTTSESQSLVETSEVTAEQDPVQVDVPSQPSLLKLPLQQQQQQQQEKTAHPSSSSPLVTSGLSMTMTAEENALSLAASGSGSSNSSESGDDLLSVDDKSSHKAQQLLFSKLIFKVKEVKEVKEGDGALAEKAATEEADEVMMSTEELQSGSTPTSLWNSESISTSSSSVQTASTGDPETSSTATTT